MKDMLVRLIELPDVSEIEKKLLEKEKLFSGGQLLPKNIW